MTSSASSKSDGGVPADSDVSEKPSALLITQCLQNDFVQPLDRFDALPNQLHVGYTEALRLIGAGAESGPVDSVIQWAYATVPAERLGIIHIRDWHDPTDPGQALHLEQFGPHCLKDSPGADFVFRQAMEKHRRHYVVNASGLNDFVKTNLAEILEPFRGRRIRAGIMGVWTEAKVTFLAYELVTRYPEFQVAVCSALTASSSRSAHFTALEQLQGVLGVTVFSSVGAFTEFLAGSQPEIRTRIRHSRIEESKLELPSGYTLEKVDRDLLLYLFRDARSVEFSVLDGGFSGNIVLGSQGRDAYGHAHVPHVVKVGDRESIARERIAFEKVQEILGNSAPSIVDFAEANERGAIKYRYAGMLKGNVRTFQKLYAACDNRGDMSELFRILDIVFKRQLGRFYEAARQERLNLLEYYDFQEKYAPGVRSRVEKLLGRPVGDSAGIEIVSGITVPNVCLFYEHALRNPEATRIAAHYTAYVHGDLNGANILVDDSNNVWLIDFFHTHRGHVLKDLIKLENDLLYIFLQIENEYEFRAGVELIDRILSFKDLGVPPESSELLHPGGPKFEKAFRTLCRLRSYYPDLIRMDRDPYQYYAGAVRYAMHTLAFDESNEWQRRLALYTGSICADRIRETLRDNAKLRVDVLSDGMG
ncbi:MAG: isochorismatase family protein, partial [Leptospirales bacterium]